MKKLLNLGCLLFALLFSSYQSFSQSTSWKGITNSNWNLAANWTNGIPDNTKDAILGDASFTGINQPKVNVAASCKSVTIGGVVATTLTMTRALTLTAGVTINGNGTLLHPGATLTLGGNFVDNGTYTTSATSSRIIFSGTSQTISGTATPAFRLVVINASSTVSLATNINVTGASSNLGVYGVIDPGQSPTYQVNSTGLTRIYTGGRIKVYAPNFTSNYNLTGTTTLYAASIVDYCSATDQVVSAAYSYSTLMINGGGVKSLAANLPLLYAKNITDGKIYVNSGTFDLLTFTANRGTTKPGGEFNIANGATLKVGGAANFPANFGTRTFGVSSTVDYSGVDQTVSGQTYGNLLFSTAGIKTTATSFSTMGNLTIANGTLTMNATIITHNVAGNFTVTGGAISGTNYTISLNGTGTQLVNVPVNILRLNINNNGGSVNLGSDITVSGTLSFTHGNINTGANDVIMPAAATVTGAAQNTGWVNGNLQKAIVIGAGVYKTFEIGETNYSPVSVLFANVSLAGTLTAYAQGSDQSEIDYSGLNPAKSVNRYWSFNNAGILFSNATAIFSWASADVDAGSTTASFKTGSFNGTSWTLPTTSSPLPTSIQASGLTALGDFCVGEIIGKSQWTGAAMTSDWFTPKNWLGLIPSAAYPTYINDGLLPGRVYPVLTGGTGIVNNLFIENASTLNVSNGTLQVAGALSSSNRVTATDGTIEFNGSSYQTIPANSFTGNTIKNLTISNNVGMDGATIVTGALSVGNGKTLSTNDNLTLKSDANGTARIAPLPVDGSGNATAFIDGNVSIERYIPARKAWRLLSAPIASSTITLQDSWQEGAYGPSSRSNPNPNPGYGVHICGGSLANGFDQSPTNAATCKVYNSTTNAFVSLPATPGTYATLNSYSGYMIYIRGDRSIDLSQGNNAAITATTLRMKGPVKAGKQTANVNATGFTVVGNPFASAIDFATITRNNVKNSFYVWDPKLNGTNGLGGYVTVSWNSGTGSYDVTTSASPVSQYIPNGEAVLMQSLDSINPGTVTIKETDKTANGSDFQFGRQSTTAQKIRVNLYEQNVGGTSALLDGTLTTYDDAGSNSADQQDVQKLTAAGENISFQVAGQLFAIERRKTITEEETNVLNIAGMKQRDYKFEIIAENLNKPGFTAVLTDKYANEINNTVLNTNGSTEVLFTITDNPASYAADRFAIVFKKAQPKLFAFKSITAAQQQKNIQVEWQTTNESEIATYTIEGSADGLRFNAASLLNGNKNKYGITSYSWFDLNAAKGDHYYRIRAVNAAGTVVYSSIVKVNISETPMNAEQISIYPNPVQNNKVSLQIGSLENGVYVIQVLNINGQVVKRLTISHTGGDFRYNFFLDNNLPAGKYQLQLIGSRKNFVTSFIKE